MRSHLLWHVCLSAGLALTFALRANGCDLCAIYAASEARGEIGRGPFAGLAEQFTAFGTMQVDGREVSNPAGQYLDSSISQLFAGYNFNNQFGLQLNVPFIARFYQRPQPLGGIEKGNVAGLGDASLLGTFVPYRKMSTDMTVDWTLVGGLKFPTGSASRLQEEFNEPVNPFGPPSGIHGHDLALGSGSYDGIVGTGLFSRYHRLFGTANLQYAIRSTGAFDYRYANDLTWAAGPGYYFLLEDDYTLGLQVVLSGEYKGLDTFQGTTAEDTAMTAVYLGPQVSFTWGSNLAAYLAADLPVVRENTGLQIVPDYRVRAGLTWHF